MNNRSLIIGAVALLVMAVGIVQASVFNMPNGEATFQIGLRLTRNLHPAATPMPLLTRRRCHASSGRGWDTPRYLGKVLVKWFSGGRITGIFRVVWCRRRRPEGIYPVALRQRLSDANLKMPWSAWLRRWSLIAATSTWRPVEVRR